tara:strand:+ start:82 stop:696 length:615 start_codon:yes stop_codon:yes gene_type:complete
MEQLVFKHTPLYRFLALCNSVRGNEKKRILDCGAGGTMPPLSLFNEHGFETVGIEFSKNQVDLANAFGASRDQKLDVRLGDMTHLPFEDASFDFVYSYNSVFHMKKKQIREAVNEMKRVLKPGGFLFVNFLSVEDFRCGEGPHLGDNQYEQMDDEPVIHSYFDLDEAEDYIGEMTFVMKERRLIERMYEGERIKQGFIDYIVRK